MARHRNNSPTCPMPHLPPFSDEREAWFESLGRRLRKRPTVMLPTPFDHRMVADLSSVEQPVGAKPRGLWFAHGTTWLEFILGEMPNDWTGYFYVLALDGRRLARVTSNAEADAFARVYGVDRGKQIDWPRVASDYDGFETTIHLRGGGWERGWDVPSGCVWDGSAVVDVEPVNC